MLGSVYIVYRDLLVGAEHTSFCADFVQVTDALPAGGMRMSIGLFLWLVTREEDLEFMVKTHPIRWFDVEKKG